MKTQLLLAATFVIPTVAQAQIMPKVTFKAQPFELSQVRLLDGPFADAMQRDQKYLLSLDPQRFLHTFRVNAGLPSTAQPLGGWEEPNGELRGHSLGHYLSACSLMYAATGDARFKERADTIVAALAQCQDALPAKGYNPGFLSAYPESFFDRVDKRQPVWAPYYTLHKIMAGLLDAYQQCGNAQALQVLDKMASWLSFRVNRLTKEQQQGALGNEHGGMNEVLANLYAVTGKPEHWQLALAFNHDAVLEPAARGEDRLNGIHANTQIPKFIGAAREYELSGEMRYRDMAQNFWQNVALHRSYAIGGHSDGEHFFPLDKFAQHLSPVTAETCNTYNMLKLTRHLFAWQPDAAEMDFYERALFNQILGSQDPETGMMLYFASLKPGHFKVYNTPENSFWCCTGTGMENHAKYGDTIYFHEGNALWVNLFIASELTWKEKGLTLRQETKFPESDTARLTFRCAKPVKLALNLRYPAWAQSIEVKVNGRAQKLDAKAGSYVPIERDWRSGDVLELRLPMALHLEALPGAPQFQAALYGPLVLAGELGKENLPNLYPRNQTDLNNVPAPQVPVFVGAAQDVTPKISPVAGAPLTFQTKGLGWPGDVTLRPYFMVHHERFNVYWHLLSAEELEKRKAALAAEAAARRAMEARIVDEVRPGEQQPETDHNLQGDKTSSGEFNGRKWRDARDGGWFSFDLKTAPGAKHTLRVSFWGDESGARAFDILVNGVKVGEQTLLHNKPGAFFDVDFPLPAEAIAGKDKITVRFQGHPGNVAGGVFGLTLLKE